MLFLSLSILTGWMVFAWPEVAAAGPMVDALFLVCVVCFLGTAIAVAVQRLHRET